MKSKPPTLAAIITSLLLVTFVAGASAGIIGDRFLGTNAALRVRLDDMSDVLDRLGLTADQRVQAESIVARTAPRSRAILMETAERLRLVADSVDHELREVLTEQQRARLDSLRRAPRFMLKRKTVSPVGTSVDTILDSRP